MTIQTDRVQEIFQDARLLQAAAVDRLDQGDIRDASEKAWGATKRSTDALVLARTGDEPERTPQTSDGTEASGGPGPGCATGWPGGQILHPARPSPR